MNFRRGEDPKKALNVGLSNIELTMKKIYDDLLESIAQAQAEVNNPERIRVEYQFNLYHGAKIIVNIVPFNNSLIKNKKIDALDKIHDITVKLIHDDWHDFVYGDFSDTMNGKDVNNVKEVLHLLLIDKDYTKKMSPTYIKLRQRMEMFIDVYSQESGYNGYNTLSSYYETH